MSRTDNLKPWAPGVSGNVAGRPKIKEELAASIRQFVPELVARLKAIALGQVDASAGESVKSAQLLLSYAFGRPPESIEISGPDGESLEMRRDSDLPDLLSMTSGEQRAYLAKVKAEIAEARLNEAAAMTEDELKAFVVQAEERRKTMASSK